MPPTIVPVIQTWGTPTSLRYAITDTTSRFWTGSTWATRQRDALLYASHHDAAAAAHRILWKQFQRRHTVYQMFSLPLEMQVFATTEVSPEDLKHFARKLVKLSALYADHGTGPTPNSLVLPRLNWGRLTQPVNSEREQDCHE
ncbi:hypothetical protein [Limnoglobus roseus]|uniref:Uncharacterized protein n=1 Tax=Limnoglobus roseus TaxID=2598579 RepID=A0A5C1AAC1_9BACT|nr:hypothetical protein [Limnoglobus roseus]QEL15123.1 hypothetical protein PX52LOC_02032 [Limnoglobus roseus]